MLSHSQIIRLISANDRLQANLSGTLDEVKTDSLFAFVAIAAEMEADELFNQLLKNSGTEVHDQFLRLAKLYLVHGFTSVIIRRETDREEEEEVTADGN